MNKYYVKKKDVASIHCQIASIYDTKTWKRNYKSKQQKINFKLLFVNKYRFFRKL